ncbi:MAG: adenylosuccinate lyase [Bacteroidetes bacterium]|nr:MAG: adenylosuccinate lyase [Bacteroidota bacterium]
MDLMSLTAISPVDGRYRKTTEALAVHFSEFGLIQYRVLVEIEYFIALCELPLPSLQNFDRKLYPSLRKIYQEFAVTDALQIKEIEKVTNHDVKAVEYFIKKKFDALQIEQYKEFIHFGLTSQDINNTAIPLSLKNAFEKIIVPVFEQFIEKLEKLAETWAEIPMLAHTHGQPASPTRLGKEMEVFLYRLVNQFTTLSGVPFAAKFGGAVGNFNAHKVAYPAINWQEFGNHFVNETLKLQRSQLTTQIENYDFLAAFCDNFKRINTILIDFSRDIWAYISMGYFKQKINENEVGSSAMPHKVNPIDFENAEGNLGFANAIFEHFSAKLPISRLQRDLTDSTVLRNIGVPLAHSLISVKSLLKGLDKLLINEAKISQDLEDNWAVVAEALQTILRRENYPNPYETLKALTRNNEKVTQESIQNFINALEISELVKFELRQITPYNYTGI